MAQLVRFEPDPEGGGDLGLAHFDDGTSLYTSASMIPPELGGVQAMGPGAMAQWAPQPENPAAVSVADTGGMSTGPDMSVQPPAPPPPDISGAGGSGGMGAVPPPLPAPAPNGGSSTPNFAPPPAAPVPGSEAAIDAQIASAQNNPIVTHTSLPLPPGFGQPQQGGQGGGQQLPSLGYIGMQGAQGAGAQQGTPLLSPEQAAAILGRGTYSPGVNPQAMLRNGVMVPTTEKTVTEAGVPYSGAEAQVRELANQKVVEAHIATAEAQATRAEAQRLGAEAAIPVLQKQAAENKAHFDTINANYQRERAQLQYEIDDFDRNAKVDPNHFFAERGAWGTIGAIVGQALGAYAATMTGGRNWAQEAINNAIDRDIDAQKATLGQQRLGQRNALARLADRYGDVDQAAAALKLSQQQIADKQILSFGAATGRDDIINSAQEWIAQNQQQRTQEELALYHASVGKQTQTQDSRFTQPSAGGPGQVSTDELLKRLKLMKELGYNPATGQMAGRGAPPIEPPNPANPLYVDLGNGVGGYARQMDEAKIMRQKVGEFGAAMESLDAAAKYLDNPSRVVGVGRVGTNEYNRAQQLNEQLITRVAKAYGGVITESDVNRAMKSLPDLTATDVTGGEAARLQGARAELIRTYQNLISATVTPYVPEPPLRATSREHQDD